VRKTTDDSYDEGSVTTDPAAEHASLSEAAEELAVAGQLPRFLLMYKFAIEELMTKLRILSEEFDFVHQHDPIEHITSRVKRPEAIKEKVHRRGLGSDWVSAARELDDIAGIRVVCPFVDDVFAVARMLTAQDDVELLRTKDYIARPKANGYRSLHLIVRIPVFLSDRVEKVKVEVQLRTIAMDFWAAVEHKLSYKYRDSVPPDFAGELSAAAATAADLDARMAALHERIR
jgi:putative GTP pyrophosphokinase